MLFIDAGLEAILRRFSARLPTIAIPEPGSKGQIWYRLNLNFFAYFAAFLRALSG
jgi:hypothetical protein